MSPREQIENLLKSLDFITEFHIQFFPSENLLTTASLQPKKGRFKIRIWAKKDLINAYDMLEKLCDELTLERKIRKIIGKNCILILDIYEK